jgi:hypothetical protein
VALWWNNPVISGMNREQSVTAERRPGRALSESSLRLTVVFTSVPGTVAALVRAGRLARDLDLSLTLMVPQVVPYQVPVTSPPVAVSHTRQMALALISESNLNACEINVQICLCRDRLECLSRLMSARSIIFVGGRDFWWRTRERKLARALRALAYEVIFVDQEERRHA